MPTSFLYILTSENIRKISRLRFLVVEQGLQGACVLRTFSPPGVHGIPLIHFIEPPRIFGKRKFHANVGETAKLTCNSRGNPDPKFTWFWKDAENKTIKISEGEEISGYSVTTSRGNAISRSTLEISTVTTDAWTNYTCKAENSLGKDGAFVSLSGKSKFRSIFQGKFRVNVTFDYIFSF